MLKRLKQWKQDRREKSSLDQKKKEVKDLIFRSGIEWKDVLEIFFWEKPLISFCIYLVFVALFWKFISYELQRIGLIILLVSGLGIVSEVRRLIAQALTEWSLMDVKAENKSLGFDLEDVIDVSAEGWLLTEVHYAYLLQLKEERNPKLAFFLAIYVIFLMVVFKFVPVAVILFNLGTFLYFYPLLNYLGVISKLFERLKRTIQPIAKHWSNTQTKRTRNRIKKIDTRRRNETDDEEFFPRNKQQQRLRKQQQQQGDPSHENVDSHFNGEFDLRGRIYRDMDDGNSSDYDDDSFLPNYGNKQKKGDTLPSLSQYDSLMEPLDDEFHAGLDFNNVSARSVSDFGIPDEMRDHLNRQGYSGGDDTDDDIDLIPVDDFPEDQVDAELRYAEVVPNVNTPRSGYGQYGDIQQQQQQQQQQQRQQSSQQQPVSNNLQDQDFELLDKTEFQDVTDEEINEQNIGGQQTRAPDIIKGVSTMLGY